MTFAARTYLDFNATAPLRPVARAAMLASLDATGNASSVHEEGRRARAKIEAARRKIGDFVGAAAENVIFTSGATEAAHQALARIWRIDGVACGLSRLLIGATEHPCLLAQGPWPAANVEIVNVLGNGLVDLAALERRLAQCARRNEKALLAVQAANNETGIIQPVAAVAALARRHGAIFICDAVQAAGRIPLDINQIGADALILSSHKLGGPMGAGALVLRSAERRPQPLLRGGGQERGARAGTENVPGIVGFGAAAEEAGRNLGAESIRLAAMREALEAGIKRVVPNAVIFGEGCDRLPNTTSFAVPGHAAETLLIAFDLAGVAVSSGSACSSGKVGASHVLKAMKIKPDLAQAAIRVSLGWSSADSDVARFIDILSTTISNLNDRRARRAA